MRTEKIGEDQGKITGVRVIEATPEYQKYEYSYQDKGKIMGMEFNAIGTYVTLLGPDGIEHGEGEAVMTCGNGDIVTYHVSGAGIPGKKFEGKFQGTLQFDTKSNSEDLKRLCKAPVLAEYESDENGNTKTTYYEWQF